DRLGVMVEVSLQKMSAGDEAPRRIVSVDDYSSTYRRERRPPDVPLPIAPVDPGRGPNGIRHPYPAEGWIQEPASIMERRPSPLILALEGPAIIGVHPVSACRVRAKADSHD